MKTKPFAKDEIVASYIAVSYDQEVEGGQQLHLTTKSTESDMYFSLSTKEWDFDNIDEFIEILKDFKKRSGI